MKKLSLISLVLLAGVTSLWLAIAQNQLGVGKDFTFPDYYPSSNGVARLRSKTKGEEYRFLSNNSLIMLTAPRIETFREDGETLEWTAVAREATVEINTREVRGNTNMFFRTSDDRLFLSGVGFLWQASNSVLILSNKTFTWIDTQKLTNSSSKRSSKMKTLVAVSLVATARLTAAEMEIPPVRPGLTITAESSILLLKSNIVIYSNNVVVIDPPAKPGDDAMILKCVWLIGRRNTNGGIQEIEAHGKVSIDKGTIHARANYAIYTATNDWMAMVGAYDPSNTNWPKPYIFTSAGPKSTFVVTNSGEAIIYDRIRDEIRTVQAETIVPGATLKSAAPTNAPVSPANRAPKNP